MKPLLPLLLLTALSVFVVLVFGLLLLLVLLVGAGVLLTLGYDRIRARLRSGG